MNASLQPSLARRFTPWLRGAGLGLALFLGGLAMLKLPCPGGGCDAVLHSRWSALLGIPVGFFGAALWLATFAPRTRIRVWAHHGLALGSLGFVALQVFVIGHFCPWCLAHAFLCWAAWPGRAAPATRAPLGLGLALAAVLLGGQFVLRQPPASTGVMATVNLAATGFDWLGGAQTPSGQVRPVVVLSLTCPVCLDLLATLPAPSATAPRIVFLTSPENRELTEMFVAAVLAHPAAPEDSFPALAALLITQRDLAMSQPAAAAKWWAFAQPDAASAREKAAGLIAAQQAALTATGITITPVRVSAAGGVESFSRWPGLVSPQP